MKRIIIFLVVAIILSGCSSKKPDIPEIASTGIVEIDEQSFVEQCREIYMDPENYTDKTIVVEGMYMSRTSQGKVFHVVYRNTPGPGEVPGEIGFPLIYDGEQPQENDWIKVTGMPIVEVDDLGLTNVMLKVTSLEIMNNRGAEIVTG